MNDDGESFERFDRAHTHLHLHLDAITVNVVHSADPLLMRALYSLKGDFAAMSQNIQEAIDNIATRVAQVEAVDDSAKALINSIPQLIKDGIADALAKGATPAQLQALDDFAGTLAANSTSLANAVAANTQPPATTPAPVDPSPTPST